VSAPEAVLAAIAAVSGTVVCVEGCGAVEVTYDAARDRWAVTHPEPCECRRHPDGPAARALAEQVLDALSLHVVIAAYGEPLPLHVRAPA
jgi:hypothetical protein